MRLLTPRSRKSGYGLLLGCRSGLDGGREKRTFSLCLFSSSKNREINVCRLRSDGRALAPSARHRNRLGVVELVGREPLIIERVENGVTFFRRKDRKRQKNNRKKGSGTQQFSVENFHFLAAGKLTFVGGVELQNWLASDHPGAYTSISHPFFGAKDVCYIEKKVANGK